METLRAAAEAVRLEPDVAGRRYTLACAFEAGGDVAQAIAQYELALHLAPADSRARCRLSDLLAYLGLNAGETASSQACAAPAAASVTAEDVRRLCIEGERLETLGQLQQALAAYSAAARLAPSFALLHYRMGCVLQDLGHREQALAHYELAARLRPDLFGAVHNAGKLAASLGLAARALPHLERAHRLRPADGISMRFSLLLEAIPESLERISATRRGFEQALDRLLQAPPAIDDPLNKADLPTFFLAYHGICNRGLNTKLARAFLAACPQITWEAPHCREPRRAPDRIKVGFISHFMRDHSIGKTTRGLVDRLARDAFEVFVLAIPPVVRDDTVRGLQERADHWIALAHTLEAARAQIAALELDVLFYQDIGMEPFSYFLAFSRLAPVQCVSFGHPDTSGIPTIDYFVSNDLYETADATEHYSERLFLLHDLPTLAYYYRPLRGPLTPADIAREQLGLPTGEHLYLCPQSLFKLHPEIDPLFAAILERDGAGRVLLIAGNCAEWTVQLRRRFEKRMPELAARISFVPRLERDAFQRLLGAADVVLDTIHFNGMNTSLEAFSTGTPVVTLPATLQRGRHTQAMYRRMGIDACIARDADEYARIAVDLASDADRRHAVRALICERNGVLYEDARVVTEFERFFRTSREAASGELASDAKRNCHKPSK